MKPDGQGGFTTYASSSYADAVAVAKERDKQLTTRDFKPGEAVILHHEEGTQLFYRSAFLERWKDWVLVFTEHHGFHVYHRSDLSYHAHVTELPIKRLMGSGHLDHCSECGEEKSVDDLSYQSHPDPEKSESEYIMPFCTSCLDKLENLEGGT